MHLPLLQDLLVLMALSVAIVFLLQRLKLPSILGFLLTGILIGPYAFSLVTAVHQVEIIAEIGVILLLFVIGLELSIKQLMSIKRTVFIGGLLQVGLTVLVSGGIYYFLGSTWNEAVFVGFLFSLSSTAIVLTIFQDRNEISSPHGKNSLGILIFQDIIVVPMMLVTPIISGAESNITASIIELVIKSAVVILVTILSARYLVPKLMHAIAKTKSKELFLLATITICFAVAFLTSEAGLSLALGAFLAGLIISESEYSHQATSIILPFRELFTSFFFISVGMLLDVFFLMDNLGTILLLLLLVFVVKASIASFAVAVLKYPPRTVLLTGLALFQVGEFAFILSKTGIEYGLIDDMTNQYFLAVSILSMLLTPFIMMFSERLSDVALRTRLMNTFSKKMATDLPDQEQLDILNNHLIIIGYGLNGSNLAKAAQANDIPFVVIELNAETVKKEKQKGVPIIYGDASHQHILEHTNLHKARGIVVAISDPRATRAIIGTVRDISQSVYLVVRTRYIKDINELKALGADDVIPEEFETSIEIFSRILHQFLVPIDEIDRFVDMVRADNYELFQGKKVLPKTFKSAKLPDFNITCMRVTTDSHKMVERPLSELQFRNNYGITVLAISRNGEIIQNIGPSQKIKQGDIVYVQGDQADIENFYRLAT